MLRGISTRILGSSLLKLTSVNLPVATHQSKWMSTVAQAEATDGVKADSSANKDMPVDIPNPYVKEAAKCILCKHSVEVDYKNVRLLSQFVSPFTGKVYDRNITGLCAKQDKLVKEEIRKAQNFGYMPVTIKAPQYLKDPKLFDPGHPIRSHRF